MDSKVFYTFILSLALGFILAWFLLNRKEAYDPQKKVIELLQDSLVKTRDSLGRELTDLQIINKDAESIIAGINQILAEKDDKSILDRLRLNRLETELAQALNANQDLSEQIKTLTVLSNETNIVIKEVPIVVKDTIRIPEEGKIHFFQANYREPTGWFTLKSDIYLSDDTVEHTLSVKNDYTIFEYEDRGRYFVRVRNNNPYTFTTGAETFQLFNRPKLGNSSRWGMGIQLGISQELKPVVSVGLHYSILKF